MLDKIIAFSIKNKFIVGIMTLFLMIWGGWSATQLPIDAVPDITNNQVQIITLCPTLAGQEVEQLVTYPIEQSIANLPDLQELRSISRFGLSVITVVFDDDVNIYFARQLINEKLKDAESEIPPGIGTPELAPVSTGLGEVYQYIIHPKVGSEDKYSAMDLRTMQDWIVSRQLYGTPGIAEVNSFGGELKQYEVAVNPDRLVAMDVSIPEIFTALEKNNENTGGAYIDKKPNAYFIRGIGLVNTFEDIRNIVVKNSPNGIPILIKDVAEVRFGSAIRYGAMTYNGEKDVVGGVVMMLKGENSNAVVNRVKEKLPIIQKSLPDDVIIEPYLDRTELVDRAMNTVEKNLIEGALIVIFVLVLFLGNFRAGLIVATAIPLSLLFALGMMNLFGVSANLMSLGAIDFGLIVDGAVIIVEATMHHLSQRKTTGKLTQDEMDHEVFISASKIRNSAAFGEIIILIVYIPILTLVGIEGKMFRPMAQTVGFAIFGALILSLTYIPMMSALFLSKKINIKKTISDRMMEFLQVKYIWLLNKMIRLKFVLVGTTVAVFALSIFLFSRMGGEFIPQLEEGDFAFHCILPQGSSLSQSIETSMQAARIIKEFDEVKMVVGKTGSAEVPTDPMPPEATDMMVILHPKKDWKENKSYEKLGEEISEELEAIPGVFFEKNQPIQMRFNELMTGIRQDVAVKIFGENLDTLLAYANKVSRVVNSVEGATEPVVEKVEGLSQITIRYNRVQIANYGLNIEDVNHIVSTAFAGGKAGVVFENERKFDLVVRLDTASRKSIEDVSHMYIPTPGGIQVPLSQVAEIRHELGPAQISREGGKRRIVIGFNVKGRDVASVVEEIQQKLDEKIDLPEGYYFTYGGQFENLQAATKRLLIAVPISLILIFVLLYFTFNSIKQATLIYTAIPMSAIGGVFALLIRGMPFSISAGIGFIALFGVAVLNGIVLIGTFNQLEKDGETDVLKRVIEGCKIRLRPVLMTAMVASLGFLPMALSHGAGAEVQKPLATVVIGGLVSATFLTLFVLPLLYILFSSKGKWKTGMPTAIAFALLFTFQSVDVDAQTVPKTMTVDEAVSMAMENNLSIQAQTLNVQSSVYLKRSVFELPKTNVNVQYGQYNSINRDNGIQVSQSIPFPTYYGAKAGLYKSMLKNSELQSQETSNEVKAQVYTLYNELQFLKNKIAQLEYLDSLYEGFTSASSLRYSTGETNLLEKATAESKKGQVVIRLEQVKADYLAAYYSLKVYLNRTEEFEVTGSSDFKLNFDGVLDTSLITDNPSLKMLYQDVMTAKQNKRLELSQALPDFTVGYFNQTLAGYQNTTGTDVYYGYGKRFQGINVGITIPLTAFSNGSKVKSWDLQQQSLLKEAENGKLQLQMELENAIRQYKQYQLRFAYFNTQGMPNIDVILNTATTSYRSGSIGYIEYVQALETATEIKLDYLESLSNLNQSIIHINFLINR